MISCIIPSRNPVNLAACTAAVWQHDPDVEIVCVWDRSRGNAPLGPQLFTVIEVQAEAFNFSRNVNVGIRHALENSECDGIVILGDDGLLESPGGFSLLARERREHPEYGLIACTTNVTGQLLQRPKNVGLREVPMACFIATYIPRRTLETVGLLDERYCLDYGVDDNDYCEACRRAGLKIGVHDGCFVDHGSLTSTYRGDPNRPASFEKNYALFKQKWGIR